MRGEEVEKQKVMATPCPQFSSDLSWAGQTDKSYGQGDASPKKLSAIIWTQDLFLLWTGLKHSRVGLAGITDCLLPSS